MFNKIHRLATKKKVPVDLIYLLILGGFYSIAIFLSMTFVNVFLWKQTESYLVLAYFHLASVIFQIISFLIGGRQIKKWNQTSLLRIGIATLALFFLFIFFLNHLAANYVFLLGSLIGVGYGFYLLAFNLLTFEITEPETRDFFNGWLGVLESFGGIIAPLLAGYIITKFTNSTGYFIVFMCSFICFILAIVFSFFIRPRGLDKNYRLKDVFHERKLDRNLNLMLRAHFFDGLKNGVFFFIITLWVFSVVKNEFALGVFNFTLALTSLITYYILTAFYLTHSRKRQLFIGSLILYLAIFLILKPEGFILVFLYALVIGVSFPFFEIPYYSLTYDIIGHLRSIKKLRVEYIVMRELFLNFGRLISILCFLVLLFIFPEKYAIFITLILFGLGHFFVYRTMRHVHIKHRKKEYDFVKNNQKY